MSFTLQNETSKDMLIFIYLQTIEDLLKKAKQGKAVDEGDIPPEVAVTVARKKTTVQPSEAPAPIYEPTIPDSAPEPAPRPQPAPRKAAPAPPPPQPQTSEGSSEGLYFSRNLG